MSKKFSLSTEAGRRGPPATDAGRAGPPASASRRRLAATAIALGLALAGCVHGDPPKNAVTLEFARGELEAGRAILIDIREPDEHATGVAPGARLLPMQQLAGRVGEIPGDPKQPVLLICNTQNRSSAVTEALRERGYSNVRYVQGGMSEWARRGWPMIRPAR